MILAFAVIGTMLNNIIISLSLFAIAATNVFASPLNLVDALALGTVLADVDPVAILAIFQHLHINEEVKYRLFVCLFF